MNGSGFFDKSALYRIVIKGQLDSSWAEWFGDLTIMNSTDESGNPISILTGQLPDQGALYGIIARLRDLGLTLLEVHQGL